jgi:ElaB/YqjD/DUF883 family membrane-anchored ribosome-binding protein/sporulation protein YlmC with PRC-barrel domain
MVSNKSVARQLSEFPEMEAHRETTPAPLPIFTNSGRRLGMVSSIFIDPYDKVVTRYEVSSGPLKDLSDGVLILPILPGTVHGQDAVIVADEQVQQLGREAGGWRVRLGQWGDTARKQAQQVSESAEKLYETGSKTIKEEAKVVRDRASKLSEGAGKLVASGSEAVKKEAQVARNKASQLSKSAGKLVETSSETVKKEAQGAREKAAKISEGAEKLYESSTETIREQAQAVAEKAADLTAKSREVVTKLGEQEEAAPEEQAPEAPKAAAEQPAPKHAATKKHSAKKSSPKHEPTEQ